MPRPRSRSPKRSPARRRRSPSPRASSPRRPRRDQKSEDEQEPQSRKVREKSEAKSPSASEPEGEAPSAKAKKEKKQKKAADKAKKKAKKAKKELKKAKKQLKKAQKKKDKKNAKKGCSSDSSTASSASSSVDINFVLGSEYGASEKADAHNPEARISKWLGMTNASGMLSFVAREDDAELAKQAKIEKQINEGVRDENGKMKENTQNDWVCMNTTGNEGKKCEARNWPRNEFCHACRCKRPRDAPLVRDLLTKKMSPNEHGRGSYNGKVCNKFMANKGGQFGVR